MTENTIIETIETAARTRICNCRPRRHGNVMVAYAISRADLVIIPSQASQLDGKRR